MGREALFLYRWWDAEDQAYVSRWAGEEWSTSDAEPGSADEVEQFRRRQISRMPILGATAENKPLLEESYHRILAAFEPNVGMTKYLFGSGHRWRTSPGSVSSASSRPIRRRCESCARSTFHDHWCGEWMTRPVWRGHGIRASRRCLE